MSEKNKISKRKAISGLGLGIAAFTVSPVFGSPGIQTIAPLTEELKDPTTKFLRLPFKGQTQPWPELVSKMDPIPDHRETSYKGSGRLKWRKALITSGDSGMGRAAAIAYAREGADVAINYYPTEEEDAIALIKAAGRKAIALPGNIRDEKLCIKLVADAVKGLGGLDILVSNAGRQQANASILDITT